MPTPAQPAPSARVSRFDQWKTKGPLFAYRKESGLTMGAIASLLGVSIGTVQNLEDGNRDPRGKTYWPALCRLLAPNRKPLVLSAMWGEWLDRKPRA
jgi:transcriptional regulator with XRE-family HTH domain